MSQTTAQSDPRSEGLQIFAFDHPHEVAGRDLAHLLGGKGSGLAEMTAALGLPVPPGFTVGLPVCRAYRDGGWPADLDAALSAHMHALEQRIGRRFGDPADPLLVSVRSGAPVSMPGMLDTVLNLGLNEETVAGLGRVVDDERFALDCFQRFLCMFATTVMDVPVESIELAAADSDPAEMRTRIAELQARIEAHAGRPVPMDPAVQLHDAVEAVFRSWDAPRARAYRRREEIDEELGTAANIQAMVFGNRGARSGTGVVFTRDPSTGAPGPYGDYLPRAQGEDVVAGTACTMPITELGDHAPAAYAELLDVLSRLETHYRDLCDVEFTIEDGQLWLLQTRVGKRGAVAAVRTAVDFVADPAIALTREEAVGRVSAEVRAQARAEVLAAAAGAGSEGELIATGLGASGGRVSGRIVLTSDAAMDAEDAVVLVRRETSPEDVAGMSAAVGILTTRGGLVSHAAVVARGWGIPAVVGAQDITWGPEQLQIGERMLTEGDVITIDGSSGEVWAGEVATALAKGSDEDALADALPELAVLEAWAGEISR